MRNTGWQLRPIMPVHDRRYGIRNPGARSIETVVKERMALYKYPRTIRVRSELGKTATVKIQLFQLRERGPLSND